MSWCSIVPLGSPGQAMLDSLTIPGLLSWVLMIIGVHTWSQRSWSFSAVVRSAVRGLVLWHLVPVRLQVGFRMTRKQWIVVGALAAVILLPVVLKLTRNDTNKVVDLEAVAPRALTPDRARLGNFDLRKPGDLAPEVTGRVKEILVEEGDQVVRDQLLMRLDPKLPQAAIEQSKALVRQARLASNAARWISTRRSPRSSDSRRSRREAWSTPTASRL